MCGLVGDAGCCGGGRYWVESFLCGRGGGLVKDIGAAGAGEGASRGDMAPVLWLGAGDPTFLANGAAGGFRTPTSWVK
jgi:hypothetical protein